MSPIPQRLLELCAAYAPRVEHLRHWRTAATRCHEESCAFAAYLCEHGVQAQEWGVWADEVGFAERVATDWRQDDSHVVCAVWCDERVFTVNWTASQYGRSEFPLIRAVSELPRRNPWLLSPQEAAEMMAQLRVTFGG